MFQLTDGKILGLPVLLRKSGGSLYPSQPVLYYLTEGAPKRGFVREELLIIPYDTQLPLVSVR